MSSVCEQHWERFILICKPEQSGKTFIMIEKIIKDLNEPIENKIIINIIFCDNNLLLTRQTSYRVRDELREFKNDKNDIYLEFSSHENSKCKTHKEVCYEIIINNINNILCCTNGTRTKDIYKIITDLNKTDPDKYYFKIWLDEADKAISQINSTFIPLLEKYDNVHIYGITATPSPLFTKFKYVNVLPLENTTSDYYHGWEDNDIVLYDNNYNTCEFVKHILNEKRELIQPGSKWFIPGETRIQTHKNIKDICKQFGFVVIIVNGEGIKLYFPNDELKHFHKDDMLNKKLNIDIYKKYNLINYPLAITGNICIGRGISILSDDFFIDYGILSYAKNKQEASQIAGRLKGNIKHWKNYKKPKVFTTEQFYQIAKEWEIKSRKLAEIAFQKHEINPSPINKSEFKTINLNYEYIIHKNYFTSYEKAKKFLDRNDIREKMSQKNSEKPITINKVSTSIHRRLETPGVDIKNGYAISSKLNKIKTSTSKNRLFREQLFDPTSAKYIGPGNCISSNDKSTKYLILPYYDSKDTPPNKEKYQVRYIHFYK